MSNLSTKPYRGTRDFYPKDQALQNYIFSTWRDVCRRFGYEEYNTPTIEPLELYAAKTSEEIVQEQTYSFEDRGGRLVTIRPEMTPSVARLVAGKRQDFGYPLRLFSIPNCMRYERPQKGRLREFWQLNADIFGVEGVEADIELIRLSRDLMKAFGASESQYSVRVNSRKLLTALTEAADVDEASKGDFMRLLDGKDKISNDEFAQRLLEFTDNHELVGEFIDAKEFKDIPAILQNHEAASSLKYALEQLSDLTNVMLDTSIARGFDYYTDIVFEVFDEHQDNTRSLFGGGRYDNLVGQFGVEPVPTAGFGMGDATLIEFLQVHDLLPDYKPGCKLSLLPLTEDIQAVDSLAASLRERGVALAVDYSRRKTDKMIKTALKHSHTHVLFVGDDELQNGSYGLKELSTGAQRELSLQQLAEELAF